MSLFFVTGLSGFTGRYLEKELLEHGHTVVGARSDLRDATALHSEVREINPDCVIHLAAISNVAHGETEDFYKVNVVGTDNLLFALASSPKPPARVLLAGSANIYGNVQVSAPIAESAKVSPANHYGISKAAMEMVASTYADALPITVVRLFNFTGCGQSQAFLVPKMVEAFASRAPELVLGNLDVRRDFSDVRDMVRYMRLLTSASGICGTINLCSGTTFSLHEVFDELCLLSGHRPKIVSNPALRRGNEIMTLLGDRSLLNSILGLAAHARDFRETLGWMYTTATSSR